jgi:LCP family protein required for cell wall assembly
MGPDEQVPWNDDGYQARRANAEFFPPPGEQTTPRRFADESADFVAVNPDSSAELPSPPALYLPPPATTPEVTALEPVSPPQVTPAPWPPVSAPVNEDTIPRRLAPLDPPSTARHGTDSILSDPSFGGIFVESEQPAGARLREGQPLLKSSTGTRYSADDDPALASGGGSVAVDDGYDDYDEWDDEPDFGSAIRWTILGTIFPGAGLVKAGRKLPGIAALVLFIGSGLALAALVIFNRKQLLSFATQSNVLMAGAAVLLALGLVWVVIIVGSHLALRPAYPTTGQRVGGAITVGLLSMAVAAPMALGANVAYTTSSLLDDLFSGSSSSVPTIPPMDPWRDLPRLNVLIIGGDSGTGRSEKNSLRADTVMVASIDTHTGATTLFSIPRQTTNMPFPEDSPLHEYFPKGFYNNTGQKSQAAEFYLNAMYRNIPPQVPDDILGDTEDLGADIMKVSVGEALGLDIHYWVIINMDGFKQFITALGGVTLNVNYEIPIGGKKGTDSKGRSYDVKPLDWIQVGPNQHFNGRLALWYARGRYGLDDYSRMERQRCVINAVVKQANPMNVLQRFQAVADAGKKTIDTDIPQSVLPDLVDLAGLVQGTKLRSVVFINGQEGFSTTTPDWDVVRKRVKQALEETEESNATPTPTPSAATSTPAIASQTPSATPSSTKSPSPTPSATKSAEPKSDDLDDACAYDPDNERYAKYQRKK